MGDADDLHGKDVMRTCLLGSRIIGSNGSRICGEHCADRIISGCTAQPERESG